LNIPPYRPIGVRTGSQITADARSDVKEVRLVEVVI
jgi:hypothetical protein